jgi:hypothetical protein
MDDILAAITDNGNNVVKLVLIIQERIHQEVRKEDADEYRKAEIAQKNVLLLIKNQ